MRHIKSIADAVAVAAPYCTIERTLGKTSTRKLIISFVAIDKFQFWKTEIDSDFILEASNHLVICAYRSFCLIESHFFWVTVRYFKNSIVMNFQSNFFLYKLMTFATTYNLIELNNNFLAPKKSLQLTIWTQQKRTNF